MQEREHIENLLQNSNSVESLKEFLANYFIPLTEQFETLKINYEKQRQRIFI